MLGEVLPSVLKGPEWHSGRPKKDRNGVAVRCGPIRTLYGNNNSTTWPSLEYSSGYGSFPLRTLVLRVYLLTYFEPCGLIFDILITLICSEGTTTFPIAYMVLIHRMPYIIRILLKHFALCHWWFYGVGTIRSFTANTMCGLQNEAFNGINNNL